MSAGARGAFEFFATSVSSELRRRSLAKKSSDATSTVPEPEHPAPAQLLRRGLTNLSQHTRCVAAPDREEDVLHVFTRFAKRLDFIGGERWLEC